MANWCPRHFRGPVAKARHELCHVWAALRPPVSPATLARALLATRLCPPAAPAASCSHARTVGRRRGVVGRNSLSGRCLRQGYNSSPATDAFGRRFAKRAASLEFGRPFEHCSGTVTARFYSRSLHRPVFPMSSGSVRGFHHGGRRSAPKFEVPFFGPDQRVLTRQSASALLAPRPPVLQEGTSSDRASFYTYACLFARAQGCCGMKRMPIR